jgi:hypothetical protein
MFTEQVDIHIARSKRSNRGARGTKTDRGTPMRGPEKTGPFDPARTMSI